MSQFVWLLIFSIVLLVAVIPGKCDQHRLRATGIFKLTHRYKDLKKKDESGFTSEHFQLFKAHDKGRLSKLTSVVVSLPVSGAADPYVVGLYYTQVKLGTPPRTYNLQVDTGSDLLWVNCNPCVGCPSFSDLKIPIVPYDVQGSSSSSKISCTDPTCTLVAMLSESGCNDEGHCGYSFEYGDGSSTVGYLVQDLLEYLPNASATVTFGCGYKQSGDLASSERALDGIIGFGSNELSIPSQLARQGRAPNIFAHCLEGGEQGGGILVLGKVLEPGIQYTPLVPFMSHYNVALQNISVNGFNLTIDPMLLVNDHVHGTIFDSGTTLAYLPDTIYSAFVQAVLTYAAVESIPVSGSVCFVVRGRFFLFFSLFLSLFSFRFLLSVFQPLGFAFSVYKAFPEVILYFNGASMHLTPTEYLIKQASADNAPIWCIGWQATGSTGTALQFTIFGDLVLKNKLVVYDLEQNRVGWRNQDCSKSIDVSAEYGVRTVGSDHTVRSDTGISARRVPLVLSMLLLSFFW